MRIAVFAYHDIGYECLKALIDWEEDIVAVATHEDDPYEQVWFRSVADLARAHDLPVHSPRNPNTPAFVNLMRRLDPELILSFYYRRILGKDLLSIPRLGGINLHGSLLPKYRGRSPVNWVLVNGENETGVTLHYMVESADAGDIVAQERVLIGIEDTALSLFRKLTPAALVLFKKTYPLIKEGRASRVPQDHRLATKFSGRRPEDGRIDWALPAISIYNLIRAVTHPYPGAFTLWRGKNLYLWEAVWDTSLSLGKRKVAGKVDAVEHGMGVIVSTGDGFLRVTRMQYEGCEELAAGEVMDQLGIGVGTVLGD